MRESATQFAPETLLGYEPTARTAKPLWLAAAPLAWSSGTQPARAGRPGWHHHAAPVVSGDRPAPARRWCSASARRSASPCGRPSRSASPGAEGCPSGRTRSIMPTEQATQGEGSGGRPPTTKRQRAASDSRLARSRQHRPLGHARRPRPGRAHGSPPRSGATYRRRAVRPGPRHQASQALVRSPALPDLVRPDWTVESRRLAVIS